MAGLEGMKLIGPIAWFSFGLLMGLTLLLVSSDAQAESLSGTWQNEMLTIVVIKSDGDLYQYRIEDRDEKLIESGSVTFDGDPVETKLVGWIGIDSGNLAIVFDDGNTTWETQYSPKPASLE